MVDSITGGTSGLPNAAPKCAGQLGKLHKETDMSSLAHCGGALAMQLHTLRVVFWQTVLHFCSARCIWCGY